MTDRTTSVEGWVVVRFGDVVRQVKEKVDPITTGLQRYVAGEHMDTDDLRIRRWGTVGEGYLGPAFTAHFLPGQVLYGSRRTYLRKVAVADFEGVCANTTFVLEPKSADLLPSFLPYVMTTTRFHEHSIKQSKGSVNPYINFRDLTWYEFGLPPIGEQERIVEILTRFFDSHEAYSKALVKIRDMREALLADSTERPPVTMKPLGTIATVVSGQSWSAKDERDSRADGATPVVGITALRPDGTIEHADPTYVLGLADKKNLFTVDSKSVLIIRTNGNAERIGNVYLANQEIEGRALSAFIFGCRFETRLQAELAFEFMRGRSFQNWATSLVAGSTGLKNLPIGKLRTMEIPSSGTEWAERLLRSLQSLRALEERAVHCRDRLDHLAQNVRETLLSGGSDVH